MESAKKGKQLNKTSQGVSVQNFDVSETDNSLNRQYFIGTNSFNFQ